MEPWRPAPLAQSQSRAISIQFLASDYSAHVLHRTREAVSWCLTYIDRLVSDGAALESLPEQSRIFPRLGYSRQLRLGERVRGRRCAMATADARTSRVR